MSFALHALGLLTVTALLSDPHGKLKAGHSQAPFPGLVLLVPAVPSGKVNLTTLCFLDISLQIRTCRNSKTASSGDTAGPIRASGCGGGALSPLALTWAPLLPAALVLAALESVAWSAGTGRRQPGWPPCLVGPLPWCSSGEPRGDHLPDRVPPASFRPF